MAVTRTVTGVIRVSAAYPSTRAIGSSPARRLRVFPGQPARVAEARAFVAAELAGCPAREALLSCVSELAANAIAHTASGAGGVFAVEVSRPADGRALVAVTDAGGPGEPSVGDTDELAECGRGLALVAALASRWGHHASPGGGRTVWAEVTWPVPVRPLESRHLCDG
jgi:anti-sigma regulatory factor (Ser/Thr protein kinase)